MWGKGRDGTCAVRRNHTVIEEDAYLTDRIADEAVDFIDRNKDRPFFLYLPFSAPHQPFQATEEYYERCSHIEDPVKRIFYAMVTALDDGVGRVLSALEEQALDDNTLVIFASDNGALESTGASSNYPLKGGKFSNFEGGINVSFMMKWPEKLAEERFVHVPVSLMDVFSTVLAAASLPLPDDRPVDGVNLLPYLTERTANGKKDFDTNGEAAHPGESKSALAETGIPRAALFWRAGYNRAVRMGAWKYIVNDRDGSEILYNLAEDKVERVNRIGDEPEAAERLKKILEEWEEGLADPAWPPVMHYRIEIDGTEYYFCI
jgi:arylsulfatase A-like enzyme